MNILFFHSYPRVPDEWKSAWTQRSHPDVCWPEKWLPADLGFDVRVLFASYSQSRAADVVDDLFKALVIRDEWDLCKNHQPLVLVGRGFGTLVLDNLFLKATEEVSTSPSPTEAGAFVRNVRSVILYGDDFKSYRIEKFFGGRSKHTERVRVWTFRPSVRLAVFITQGSIFINPAIHGKNLTQEYQFEAIRPILEHLQQKLDNIAMACDISNYSDSMFENEFTYLRRNGIEGAKILIVQRMLATMGVDVEQHMVAKKSDDGEQLENERTLAILKFTVEMFCERHEWHSVPTMRESDIRHTIESSLNDVVHGISPLSDDFVNERMQRERERESMDHSGREAFRRDGNDTVPIHFPSIREQSIMSVKQLQQLACNYMRPGENLPQEDVQEQLMAHMAQVLHGGKLIVTARILEGKIQFLFGNAKSMAQIVGVGLDFAIVSLTHQNVIVVEGILGFNYWDYILPITRFGSATRDTSGEGGSHLGGTDTPSEGDKDQVGDGGDGDDNGKGRGAKGKEIQQNNQCDIPVIVVPGYEPGVWSSNIDPTPEQLKKSHIDPILRFSFKKTGNQRSIESRIDVSCGMHTSLLDEVNHCSERFGWCQNQILVSLQCLQPGAATLFRSGLRGAQDGKEIFMEQTQATTPQAKVGVTGGFHGFVSGSASLTMPFASRLESNQRVIEIPSQFISGTGFHASCHDVPGPTPSLSYGFKFRPRLPTNRFPDGSDQDKYHGMRCTVNPSFEGVWDRLSQDRECKYKFQVERNVCELVRVHQSQRFRRGKQKHSCNCNVMWQRYEVTLLINHTMLDIGPLQESGMDVLCQDNPENTLVKLRLNPSGRGSDEASSSTQ
ncbi:unnamed protein product [Sphagnum troendelagicum]